MKKVIKIVSCGLAVAALGLAATSCEDSKNNQLGGLTENEKEMKAIAGQYVPNVIYSIYGDLAKESGELYDLLAAAAEDGADQLTQARIDAICAKFLQARQSWEESEAFLFGAATDFGIDPHIDTWPLDVDGLATELANAEKVAALAGEDGIAYAAAKLGQELLGFHGIEFVLFRDGKNRTVAALQGKEDHEAFGGKNVTGEQELIYAAAVAGDLRDNCYRLCVSWNPNAPKAYVDRCEELEVATTVTGSDLTYGENLLGAAEAGSSYKTWQSAMASILVAGCSNICAEVADVKMGNAHTGEDVNYIESPYSKKSFQDFIDNILSIQYSLYGAAGASSAQPHSLMAFFKEQGYSNANAIQSALDASLAALRACQQKGAFVDIYKDASVQTAMDEISALDDEINKAADWILRQ
ncbi:MAG: imelysin [Bacteroidales bacterium]|nr:imelysin [Bacteroidales bacterium]